MPEFAYRGWNAERNAVSGEIAAETVAQAVMQLEAQGIEIASIGLVERKATVTSAVVREGGESDFDPELLRAPIEQVLAQGELILPALHAFAAELPHGRRKQQIEQVCQVIEDGNTGQALQALVENPEYWLPLVGAMSSKHDPVRALKSFFAESQSAEEQRGQWRRALIYPLLCLAAASAVLIVISIHVIPIFASTYLNFAIRLPAVTVAIIKMAHVLRQPTVQVAVTLFFVLSFFALGIERWIPQHVKQKWYRRLPKLITAASISQLANRTADLLSSGAQISMAIRIASVDCVVPRFRHAAWSIAQQLDQGEVRKFKGGPLSSTILYALQTDMPLRARIRFFREIAAIYREKSESRISWSRGIIEPLLICLTGLIVGAVVLALFLPLITLTGSL